MDKQLNLDLKTAIMDALNSVELDVKERNSYMNERDRMIYGTGLFDGLEFPDGIDKTMYNFLRRIVDIHTSQMMGRGFQIYSTYNKRDMDDAENQEQPEAQGPEGQEAPEPDKMYKLIGLENKKLQRNADTRKKLVDAMIRDNGGVERFKHGSRIGSSYGLSVFKTWLDQKNKMIKISLLETPQNYYPGWTSTDFRERDWDAYVYQVSESYAYKNYGQVLDQDAQETFENSRLGAPLEAIVPQEDITTRQKMVTVVDFTGILPGYGVSGKKVVKVKRGQETQIGVKLVGGKVVETITDPDLLPRYWPIDNLREPQRASGKSDISDSAIEINRTFIEVMSTWVTIFHKEIAPVYQAKGFDGTAIPKRKRKMATFVPMDASQEIVPVQSAGNQVGMLSEQLINELKDNLVRVSGIGRVLFDDPTINPSSNQALMTTLKGVIDIVEDKQSRWEPVLVEMFTDALKLATKLDASIKDVVNEDGWNLYVRWPSVLRREDSTYQQMWLNRLTMGTTSLGSYLEAMGVDDVSEELDRMKDEMKQPLTAAVLGKQLGLMANQTIAPPAAPGPDVKVNLRGDLTPYQEANLASQQGFNNGPFPPTAGPQGQQGLTAGENADNQGFIQGDAFNGGTPIQQGPDGQPVQDQQNPVLTPDQNTGQTASMPGSGQAQPVSPEGAMNQLAQRNGG